MTGGRGVCAAGLAALAIVSGCGGDDAAPAPTGTVTPTASTTSAVVTDGPRVERPVGFPRGAEPVLLAALDADRRDWCTRETRENRHPGSRDGIFCDLREPDGVRLYVDVFPANAAAARVYSRYRVGRRVPSGAPCAAPRTDRRPGEGAWARGRVMCFVYRRDFWLVYTDTRARTLAFVVAREAAPVRTFFRTVVRAGG
ncbi:MAG: hypothetical protein IT429_14580 [Gemmataceae bacterium]|nr:hypothetical protein [Gemmataceae bacterium]